VRQGRVLVLVSELSKLGKSDLDKG
jgi:hypothetical protein